MPVESVGALLRRGESCCQLPRLVRPWASVLPRVRVSERYLLGTPVMV
jgi:hypothetical protein